MAHGASRTDLPLRDTELESLLSLDEDAQTALQAGRRYDLGLAVAMAPGLVLLLFATLAYRPLSPVLQVIRVVGYVAVFPVCAVGIGVPAVRQDAQGPAMRSQARVFRAIWLGVLVLAFAWGLNGAADPGPGTVLSVRLAHRYHDPSAADSPFAAPLHLASVPGFPAGLPIYDPAATWANDHAAGDPVRLTVGPGALGVRIIRALALEKK